MLLLLLLLTKTVIFIYVWKNLVEKFNFKRTPFWTHLILKEKIKRVKKERKAKHNVSEIKNRDKLGKLHFPEASQMEWSLILDWL